MSGQYFEFDDLYVSIIMALTDEQVTSLPKNVSVEELARRFPQTFELCSKRVKADIEAKSREISVKCADSSDGTQSKVE